MKRKYNQIDEVIFYEEEYLSKGYEKFDFPKVVEKWNENDNNNEKVYCTHNGMFHCDDALALGLLFLKTKDSRKNSTIIRTREEEIIKKSHYCVDVGGVYDLENNRFDHHQKEFNDTFNEASKIRLSSSGLVYKKYGKDIILELLKEEEDYNKPSNEKEAHDQSVLVDILYNKIYFSFMMEIDAHDNGIMSHEGGKKIYDIHTKLSLRIRDLNPSDNNEVKRCKAFERAMYLTTVEFLKCVGYYIRNYSKNKLEIMNAFEKRFETHKSGKVLELTKWISNDIIYEVEYEEDLIGKILFVIYPTDKEHCRIGTISKKGEYFKNRLSIKFGGLRDDVLSEKFEIKDCVFVHVNGFTGENKTKEGALKMIEITIKEWIETKPIKNTVVKKKGELIKITAKNNILSGNSTLFNFN